MSDFKSALRSDESKPSWGDIEDEDDNEEGTEKKLRPLPDNYVTEPGPDGIKKLVTFKYNDKKEILKCTKSVRVHKKTVKMSKAILERRKWAKFGVCAGEPDGYRGIGYTSATTMMDISEQILDLTPKEKKAAETNTALDNAFLQQQVSMFGAWKPSWQRSGAETMGSKGESAYGKSGPLGNMPPNENDPTPKEASSGPARYVPPSMRGSDGSRMEGRPERDENATVRVSNLSEDVTDSDLRELFRRFGPIQRIYLAKDRETHTSRGFAFINFHEREDGVKAIAKLNGHGYDHLILSVDWAAPSVPK